MSAKLLVLIVMASIIIPFAGIYGQEEQGGEQKLPPPRNIPGITSEDNFPNACVDCHINYKEIKMDTRFSTLMQLWKEKVDSTLLIEAQDSAPEGMILKGRHPNTPTKFNNIPAECLTCHKKKSKIAPPFASLIHRIHLTGGAESYFLTLFQGECTYCHKLNQTTGAWTMPSAPEH